MEWFRRSFITGFFVTVPLVISVVTFVWIFRTVDGLLGPLFSRWIGYDIPGLGLLTTVAGVAAIGAVATNVLGKRILQRGEYYLLKVPLFRTIYAPAKQLIAAFSPDNEMGFKRVVLVQDPRRGYVLGFLTREFTLEAGSRRETLVAVYVPTNHLYLGDVAVFPREAVSFPELTVEQGIRIFLTGGMALGGQMELRTTETLPPSAPSHETRSPNGPQLAP
jgi:uncharacterized membrane protein